MEGQGWQLTANLANTDGEKVRHGQAQGGRHRLVGHLDGQKDTPNINCAYLWLNHVVSPEVNAQIAEYFGEAPANQKSCALTKNTNHCTQFHAGETDFWKDVYYWTTPTAQCLDGRTDTQCVAYDDWVKAWSKLRSS